MRLSSSLSCALQSPLSLPALPYLSLYIANLLIITYLASAFPFFSLSMVLLHGRGRKLSPTTLRQKRYPFLVAVAGTADVGLLFLNRSLLISADSFKPTLSAVESQGLR